MNVHIYFSLMPEALIASNLPPEKFGQYYSTGQDYKSKGQCLFFEVEPSFRHPYFEIDEAIRRCVPAADGTPKHSVYIASYRVLEHLPVSALGKLYLTTAYGQTLGLSRGTLPATQEATRHLYQELVPVNSLVVSNLTAQLFSESITTKPTKFIRFPSIFFVELSLGALAEDPTNGDDGDLPYPFIPHLREKLSVLSAYSGAEPTTRDTKMVNRVHSLEFPYRMVKNGFYVGSGDELAFYPMPTQEILKSNHHQWWHSANS